MRLNSFTYQMGGYSSLSSYTEPFDLLNFLKENILNSHKFTKNIIIIGERGAGKTLLLLKMMKDSE